MLTSLYYGHWDYWELRHKVTFDGVNRLIWINDGVTSLDMQIDVYSDWKEWMLLGDNTKYYSAFNTVGGEPTIEGQRLDVTYFLINGWKLKPYPGSYDLSIIGNVFDVDGGSIKVPADVVEGEPNNISITTNTSVIVRQIDGGTSSSGSVWDPDTIVSASLFGEQLDALLNPNVTASIDPDAIFSASLYGIQEDALFDIQGRVIAIESILQQPLTASLVPEQSASLYNVEQTTYSSSVDIINLLDMNYSQSVQLTELQTLNFSQSIALYEQNLLLNSQSLQLDSIETIIVSQSSSLDSVYEINVSQSLQLDSMDSQLDNIEFVINSTTGSSVITDDKVREIWEIHGLDTSKQLKVTQTKRTVGTIDQDIITIGTGSAQQTTVDRN